MTDHALVKFTDHALVKFQVDGRHLPQHLEWADGLWMRVPPFLARALGDLDAFPPPRIRDNAREAAAALLTMAAFTPNAPASARLPISYRHVPGGARRLLARGAGMLHGLRQNHWAKFPGWPIDLSADFAADLAGDSQRTFAVTPVLLTHDIDSAEGLVKLVEFFLPLEEAVRARSANFIVPCGWPLDYALITEAWKRGHEIGVHGYDHSNQTPFVEPPVRRSRLAAGRRFGERFGAAGYRAPSLLRTAPLLTDLAQLYRYDSSIPTSGGPFPCPNQGCASARPWRFGGLWEIPLTLPRDGSLQFLGYSSPAIGKLWREIAVTISRSGGVVSLLTHCERGFSGNNRMLAVYRDFLEWLASDSRFEFVRPADLVDRLEERCGAQRN